MTEHALKIESLRDLKATCTCGGWAMTRPTFDRESDLEIIGAADREHGLHITNLPALSS